MKPIKVEIYSKGRKKRTIGIIQDDFFIKHVKLSKHLFWRLDAWGIDAPTFENVLRPQKKKLRVIDDEEKKVYEVDSETFGTYGKEQHFAGYGRQIFLPRRWWKVKGVGEKTQQGLFQ